jgi:hypothetical protein
MQGALVIIALIFLGPIAYALVWATDKRVKRLKSGPLPKKDNVTMADKRS